jgi:hypothetical protein
MGCTCAKSKFSNNVKKCYSLTHFAIVMAGKVFCLILLIPANSRGKENEDIPSEALTDMLKISVQAQSSCLTLLWAVLGKYLGQK